MKSKNVAGMSLKGGRKDNFFFCLLEHYPENDRWFLKSLLQVKDEEGKDGNEAIKTWLNDYEPQALVVDIPLTNPECKTCKKDCKGAADCEEEATKKIQKQINSILLEDLRIREENPKQYEFDRNVDDLIDYSKDFFDKETHDHILSRSFKRKLKKGYLPYWNRPIDVWVWYYYYDSLLDMFNIAYDSFGNISLMRLFRFSYLKSHFSSTLNLHEGNIHLTIIELLRASIIRKKDALTFMEVEAGIESRLDIIKAIEKKLDIFIYDNDLETIVHNPRAFESFLLALAGKNISLKKIRTVPDWAKGKESNFVVPIFSRNK